MSVIPARFGGLGNQMFQVSAAMVLAAETNKKVVVGKTNFVVHNTVGDYSDTFFTGFDRVDAIVGFEHPGYSLFPGGPYGFEPWAVPADVAENVIMHGYFQYYPPIAKHETEIRSYFVSRLPKPAVRHDGCVGVHVRRGDYLRVSHVHYVQDASYYASAMAKFKPDTRFVIFSDDIAWCRGQEAFKDCTFVDEPNELQTLSQMATCSAGFVCGNSTFSWWGAFLGAYALRNPVIVPSRWISERVYDLFPPEWIVQY